MRIALLGTRGIPANYGGFETFAEEISTRLVQRGHQVTVYCRDKYAEPAYRGVKLVYLPTIRHKYLDTLVHTKLSTWHLLFHRVDVALYCNAANAIFTNGPRLMGIPVVLNVDGIERKRKKWNAFARAWYLMSEYLATVLPNAIVADAEVIQQYYAQRYGKTSTFIPYGAETGKESTSGVLRKLGLEPGQYFLYVSRMEPENHALQVRCAFEKVPSAMKLALIGDAPHAAEYIAQVRDTQDPRVVMPGGIYGIGYRELGSHCFAYIHATEVGGTHPALIEAMGRGALTIYRNTPENAEVCADAGLPFEDEESLTARMREVIAMPEATREEYRRRAVERVKQRYNWSVVTMEYERLLASLVGRSIPVCDKCEHWCKTIEVRSPDAYRQLMKDLAQDITAGTLREQGEIPPITEIVWNWPYQNDDVIDRKLECASCHRMFGLAVETYHGRGGEWQPIAP